MVRSSPAAGGKRQLISCEEATTATGQHRKPCGDCPWARTALNGWLGGDTIEDWLALAHGEGMMECHTLVGAQCAGASIYRANVCKLMRNPEALQLPADRERVFASPAEFRAHHEAPVQLRRKDGT